jgi:hypothetical protein
MEFVQKLIENILEPYLWDFIENDPPPRVTSNDDYEYTLNDLDISTFVFDALSFYFPYVVDTGNLLTRF